MRLILLSDKFYDEHTQCVEFLFRAYIRQYRRAMDRRQYFEEYL